MSRELAALRRAPAGMVVPACAAHYVGIPFAPKGYDRAGCNCWGLVCLVYAEQLGVALPRHEDAYDGRWLARGAKLTELRRLARVIAECRRGARAWRQIDWAAAAIFDVALLPIGGAPCHVGLYVGGLHLLHVEEGSDSVCEDLRDGRLAARLERAELYRYAGGAQ